MELGKFNLQFNVAFWDMAGNRVYVELDNSENNNRKCYQKII